MLVHEGKKKNPNSEVLKQLNAQQRASKIKSLTLILDNLLAKKMRIDLEIKKIKISLSHEKSVSESLLHEAFMLGEDDDISSIDEEDLANFCNEFHQSIFEYSFLLDATLRSKKVLEDYQTNFANFIGDYDNY